jgi:hypothetical protein
VGGLLAGPLAANRNRYFRAATNPVARFPALGTSQQSIALKVADLRFNLVERNFKVAARDLEESSALPGTGVYNRREGVRDGLVASPGEPRPSAFGLVTRGQ